MTRERLSKRAGNTCCCPLHKAKKTFTTEEAKKVGDQLNADWDKIDLEEFRIGLGVELEHRDITHGNMTLTAKIAIAHLKEVPDYYTRLMEHVEKAEGEGTPPVSGGGPSSSNKIRRLQTREDGVQQHYLENPDWFDPKKGNLDKLSDQDLLGTHNSVLAQQKDNNQIWMDAVKQGVTGEELAAYRKAWTDPYDARRHLARELKKRDIPFNRENATTQDRVAAVKEREKAPPTEKQKQQLDPHPMGSINRAITEISMTDAETKRYQGERIIGPHRQDAFDEFMSERELNPHHARSTFFFGYGRFQDAPLTTTAAVGKYYGYEFEDVWKRVDPTQRAKYPKEVLIQASDDISKMIPAVAAWSRQYYKEQGIESLTLYKAYKGGSMPGMLSSYMSQHPEKKEVPMGLRPVSTWTTDLKHAERHAGANSESGGPGKGAIVKIEVPIERVLWSNTAFGEPPEGDPEEVNITSDFKEAMHVPKENVKIV